MPEGSLVREPAFDFGRVRELRAHQPDAVTEAAKIRRRRSLLDHSGRLMLIAADHPARGALGVRADAMAMADRYDLLRRMLIALGRPGVDGVLGTADILEDLLLLGALEDKVVIGSMNRGGLQGADFELDDRFTGYDPATIEAMGWAAARCSAGSTWSDQGTVRTLEACARAVTELAQLRLMAMLEPFISRRADRRVTNDLSAAAVVRSVAIATGLGATSRVYLAETAGGRGHGAGDGGHHSAHVAARRRPVGTPGRDLRDLGEGARAARRTRPGGRPARCSTRRTATWRPRSTRRPPWSGCQPDEVRA